MNTQHTFRARDVISPSTAHFAGFTVSCHGPNGDEDGGPWRIRNREEEDAFERIAIQAFNQFGVRHLWMPSPVKFNARIAERKGFTKTRWAAFGKVMVHEGCFADGVVLRRGEAFALTSADCPAIVFEHYKTRTLIAVHGGRDCLIDRKRIETGKERDHESVVDAACEKLRQLKVPLGEVRVYVACGIGPEHFDHRFDHPTHGEFNKKMIADLKSRYDHRGVVSDDDRGCIDLGRLIAEQCCARGMKRNQIVSDDIDTAFDPSSCPSVQIKSPWASTRVPERAEGRNLVLVVHRK